jgi:hypothetical protein
MKRLRLGLIVAVGLLLVGCGKHYWSKAGSGPEDFQRESMECARENSVQMTANKDYGIVIADLYKMCLRARGWNRAQQLDPPPAGWYRGIEEDEPMRFGAPAAAPRPTPPPPPAGGPPPPPPPQQPQPRSDAPGPRELVGV